MKFKLISITIAALVLAACSVRDTTHHLSINEALNSAAAKKTLNSNVKLYFAKSAKGTVLAKDLVTNKKTNAANKTDVEACQWAFLSAVKQFQDRAVSMGATKVTNLVSYYKKNVYSSATEFECHAGHLISGVALKGDIVK
ncbi:excinuclease ABC subunit A [Lonepinella sp. MS14436]|uniref:excinuclease ABC subunit A n=1 Tax=Lonepinella sp. MS14436 TaxID=3003619 RepID=UPI0036DCA5D9